MPPDPQTVGELPVLPQQPPDRTTVQGAVDERERTSLGQRRINLIWEITQATVALLVVGSTVGTAVILVLRGDGQSVERGLALLTAAFFLVIGTYFQRTNHTRTGGTGPRDGSDR